MRRALGRTGTRSSKHLSNENRFIMPRLLRCREIRGIRSLSSANATPKPNSVEANEKLFRARQNGSDIRGIAIEGVPNEPVSLTPGLVFFIGQAFAQWVCARLASKGSSSGGKSLGISVGSDPRISGPLLEAALIAGLSSGGASRVDSFGLATTPCMFYSIKFDEAATYQGAIILTASHMPFNSNGLKFFTLDGGLEKTDIATLLQMAAKACSNAGVLAGDPMSEGGHVIRSALMTTPSKVGSNNFLPEYSSFLRELIKKGVDSKDSYHQPLKGLRIVVDAGNGSGGFFATSVLAPLGANVNGSRFLDPDGTFPNHIPNPEHPSAMASGAEAVIESQADLGIVFDTDVDRSAIVDRSGREINSNRFIALMSSIVLRDHPGSTIVTDSVTSNGLSLFIQKLGGKHLRFKRGYKNVISKGIELNESGEECHLMMETSGHGAIKSNHYLDDGSYLAVLAVIELVRQRALGKDISDLLADLTEAKEASEFRIRIKDAEFKPIGSKVLDLFHAFITGQGEGKAAVPDGWTLEAVNYEGWRVNVDEGEGRKGWILLRQSLHDPLLVLNVESEVEGGANLLAHQVLCFFEADTPDLPLDLNALQKTQGLFSNVCLMRTTKRKQQLLSFIEPL